MDRIKRKKVDIQDDSEKAFNYFMKLSTQKNGMVDMSKMCVLSAEIFINVARFARDNNYPDLIKIAEQMAERALNDIKNIGEIK